ncbi:MAG: iron ABC transporter permease, partial [Gammaproteobacteria bacterium]|nr:iron ABC transporter permease [Gammaproteobacteria bacterium]
MSVWPVGRLLLEGIAPHGALDSAVLLEVLGTPSTWNALWRSVLTAAGGTLVALAIGVPFAALVALSDIRAKPALVFCFMIPLMIPPQITALSWIQLFGPSSALLKTLGLAPPLGTPHPLYSPQGIMLLLGVQHAPLVFLALRASLRSLPRELVEAARSSGATHRHVVSHIVLPLMRPALIAGGALAFVSGLGNFGIPAMLGIPISYATMPVLIYQRLSGFGPAVISEVAVLSLLIALVAALGIVLQSKMTASRDYRIGGASALPLRLTLGRWRVATELCCWLVIILILVVPLLALLATSLVPAYGVVLTSDTATLEAYREVLLRQPSTTRAFGNSFTLALMAAVVLMAIALPLGYLLTRKRSRTTRALATLAEIPYALPGVVLAIACILIFIKPLPVLGFALYGTLWIIFFAYLARFLALALRPVMAGFEQLDPHLEEAAQISGAGFLFRFRTIIVPSIGPVAAAGAILVFMTAFNELTVSALLWSSGTETLGVLVYNLDDGGYTSLATALAIVAVA